MSALETVAGLAGGLGLFLYGMKLCSEGLQKVVAHRLKRTVKVLTKTPIRGVLVGALVTLGLQSSSATSAVVVGLVSAGMMTLSQTLGVLLGSAIGSSLTIQLIAFKVTVIALFLVFFGVILYLFAARSRNRSLGQLILGFGLIFYGMAVISTATAPVKDFPLVARMIISLEEYPLLSFSIAVIITAIIQSSAGFLAILISLAGQGLVGPYAIIPFVLGAHLGGTVTGVLSSLGAPGRDSKRAALANFFFKLLNGVIFLPFYQQLTSVILWSSSEFSRQIANAHTLFSLVMAIGFLPFTPYMATWMERLIPEKEGGLGEAKFLKENLLEVPELAVDQAHRQTVEMGRIISEEMLKRLLPALRYKNNEAIDWIVETEQAVDSLYKQINKYMVRLDLNSFSEELLLRSVQILYTTNDLEHIGDILLTIGEIGRKVAAERFNFSEEAFEGLESLYALVNRNYHRSLKAFEDYDQKLAGSVIRDHPRLLRREKELQFSHFERMQSDKKAVLEMSSWYLDLIEALTRIDNHSVNIARGVLGIF